MTSCIDHMVLYLLIIHARRSVLSVVSQMGRITAMKSYLPHVSCPLVIWKPLCHPVCPSHFITSQVSGLSGPVDRPWPVNVPRQTLYVMSFFLSQSNHVQSYSVEPPSWIRHFMWNRYLPPAPFFSAWAWHFVHREATFPRHRQLLIGNEINKWQHLRPVDSIEVQIYFLLEKSTKKNGYTVSISALAHEHWTRVRVISLVADH